MSLGVCMLHHEWTDWLFVKTKLSCRTLLIIWFSSQLLGIKVQSCPALR